MRLESTVLTDLSANVFAALLLILLILLQAGVGALQQAPAAPPRPVEATTDLTSRPREPMRAAGLVALLYDRRPDAPGLSLDLGEARVGAQAPGRGAVALLPETLGPLLREVDPAEPVRLYVFSHRLYAEVVEALARDGRRWREVSVPRSLRDPAGAWSPGFLGLFAGRPDLARFRDGLARLLAAPAPPAPAVQSSPGGTGAPDPTLLGRLGDWLRAAVAATAILGGLAAVLAVELLVPRAGSRYRRRRDVPPATAGRGGV